MWYNILPAYLIITGAVAFSGYGLWWAHRLVLENVSIKSCKTLLLLQILLQKGKIILVNTRLLYIGTFGNWPAYL